MFYSPQKTNIRPLYSVSLSPPLLPLSSTNSYTHDSCLLVRMDSIQGSRGTALPPDFVQAVPSACT